jgi:integrase
MATRTAQPYLNANRFWGNFERFAAVGGKREPLIAPGERKATADLMTAQAVFEKRWKVYERALERHHAGLVTRVADTRGPTLARLATSYLEELAAMRRTDGAPVHAERDLQRRQRSILTCLETPTMQRVQWVSLLELEDCDSMLRELAEQRTAQGPCIKPSTVRTNALEFSAVLTEAVRQRLLPRNPLPQSRYLPVQERRRALDDGAYLTREETCRLLEQVRPSRHVPYATALVMALVYSGMRREEAMALLVQDVNFFTGEISVVPNDERELKSKHSVRRIPLWPKLRAVLDPLVQGRPGSALLFPSALAAEQGDNQPIESIDGTLSAAARRAGLRKKVHHHLLRHTYVSARLQMLHVTATGTRVPVDAQLVASEIGHADEQLIRTVYGHRTRERVDQVELDYGETLPPPAVAEQLAKAERGARIREGLAARKARKARAAAGGGAVHTASPSAPLTAAEKGQRVVYARQIRHIARRLGLVEAEVQRHLGATPAEVTAILRGDLGRQPLARVAGFAATMAKVERDAAGAR